MRHSCLTKDNYKAIFLNIINAMSTNNPVSQLNDSTTIMTWCNIETITVQQCLATEVQLKYNV